MSWASVQPLRLLSICHKTSIETESINIYGNRMSNFMSVRVFYCIFLAIFVILMEISVHNELKMF